MKLARLHELPSQRLPQGRFLHRSPELPRYTLYGRKDDPRLWVTMFELLDPSRAAGPFEPHEAVRALRLANLSIPEGCELGPWQDGLGFFEIGRLPGRASEWEPVEPAWLEPSVTRYGTEDITGQVERVCCAPPTSPPDVLWDDEDTEDLDWETPPDLLDFAPHANSLALPRVANRAGGVPEERMEWTPGARSRLGADRLTRRRVARKRIGAIYKLDVGTRSVTSSRRTEWIGARAQRMRPSQHVAAVGGRSRHTATYGGRRKADARLEGGRDRSGALGGGAARCLQRTATAGRLSQGPWRRNWIRKEDRGHNGEPFARRSYADRGKGHQPSLSSAQMRTSSSRCASPDSAWKRSPRRRRRSRAHATRPRRSSEELCHSKKRVPGGAKRVDDRSF